MIGAFQPPESKVPPLEWALAYAGAGMEVFPVGANKKPLTKHGLKDASTLEAVIRAWWGRHPHADIAWAVPADIVVLDLDVGKGGDGFRDFVAREGTHANDVPTPQASTPRGGRHLLFSANGGAYKNGVRLNCLAIDLRTVGGYVVLPGPDNGPAWLRPLVPPFALVPKWVTPAPHYAHPALERACKAIEAAPEGQQELTLNSQTPSGGLSALAKSTTKPPSRRSSRPPSACRHTRSRGVISRRRSEARSRMA
jgi:hypothetical protein